MKFLRDAFKVRCKLYIVRLPSFYQHCTWQLGLMRLNSILFGCHHFTNIVPDSWALWDYDSSIILLRPANKVCEGYVFTDVCLSTGGCAWLPGARGCAWWRGVCVTKGGGVRGIGRDTINERAVRILLECILVWHMLLMLIFQIQGSLQVFKGTTENESLCNLLLFHYTASLGSVLILNATSQTCQLQLGNLPISFRNVSNNINGKQQKKSQSLLKCERTLVIYSME